MAAVAGVTLSLVSPVAGVTRPALGQLSPVAIACRWCHPSGIGTIMVRLSPSLVSPVRHWDNCRHRWCHPSGIGTVGRHRWSLFGIAVRPRLLLCATSTEPVIGVERGGARVRNQIAFKPFDVLGSRSSLFDADRSPMYEHSCLPLPFAGP
jgi:hypothetical protein